MQDHSASDGLDVIIDGPHRGPVRCAKLLVREGASLVGDVRADFVKVLGRLDGNVQADVLAAGPTARLMRGVATLRDTPVIAPGATIRNFTMFIGLPAETPEPVPAAPAFAASRLPATAAVPAVAAEPEMPSPEIPAGFGGPDFDDGEAAAAPAPETHATAALAAGSSGLRADIEAAIRAEIETLRREYGTEGFPPLGESLESVTEPAEPEAAGVDGEDASRGGEPDLSALAELEAEIAAVIAADLPPAAPVPVPQAARATRTFVLPSLV